MEEKELGELVWRQVMMPKDLNPLGSVFGGLLISMADVGGAVAAMRHARTWVATRHVDHFDFLVPIHVGEVVSFYGKVVRVNQTSMVVRVTLRVERLLTGEHLDAGSAEIVYVAVDQDGNPVQVAGSDRQQ